VTQELTEVQLYGALRSRFGRGHRLAVSSPAEAVRALCVVVPGFRAYVLKHSAPGYRVVVGKTPIGDDEEIHYPSGRQAIKIVPAVAGKAGLGKVVAGAALIALSIYTGGAGLSVFSAYASGGIGLAASSLAFSLGTSLVLGGISQMLASNPAGPVGPAEKANNQPSYAFNGPINTTGQGNPVPICYGRLRIGSQVISTGLSVAQLA
jgi:predicted phage tail protein